MAEFPFAVSRGRRNLAATGSTLHTAIRVWDLDAAVCSLFFTHHALDDCIELIVKIASGYSDFAMAASNVAPSGELELSYTVQMGNASRQSSSTWIGIVLWFSVS